MSNSVAAAAAAAAALAANRAANAAKALSAAKTAAASVTVISNTPASTATAAATVTTTETDPEIKPMYPRLFNKIVLTLENSLLPDHKLAETPSHVDGLDPETEKDLRILGCELIQTAGILLKLPQVAMATGQVLFQRFFYSKSFVRHNMETVAMSCVCLASKIEEAPRRIRDVINVFHHIKQVRAQKEIMPMLLDQYYTNLKTQVIKAERRVLKELGFCVHVKHPHKLIVMYMQVLKYETNEKMMQMSWNFMNDSLRTDVFMRYHPETIACACIYLSARKLGIPLPNNPPWYGLFRVKEEDIIDICYRVLELYTRNKPNVKELEGAVEELKKRCLESRNKNKEQSTPPAVTTVDRNNGSHNAWGGFIQRTIPLPLPTEKSPEKKSRSRSRSRSHSRSPKYRSRSRSPKQRSRSPRSRERSHSQSLPPPKSKKKSRHYSRSPSSSPSHSASKHRKRKSSRSRERSDYYSSSGKEHPSNSEKYDKYDKYRERERERDRDRERNRDRERDKYHYEREVRPTSHHHHNHHHREHHSSMHQKHQSHSRGYSQRLPQGSRASRKHHERDRSRDHKR